VSTTDTYGMDLGRYLNISAAPNDGVLSAATALVVLVVLFWALMPRFWQVPDEMPATGPATGLRSHAVPSDATFPIPRTPRDATYPAGPRPAGSGGPRHAARPARMPRVTGAPPWEPAPRPPETPPAD
jgi:hypothetical protein